MWEGGGGFFLVTVFCNLLQVLVSSGGSCIVFSVFLSTVCAISSQLVFAVIPGNKYFYFKNICYKTNIRNSLFTSRIWTYAWWGSVIFIPLISMKWNDGISFMLAAFCRQRITSCTVAVFPVPGTPEIYIHLKHTMNIVTGVRLVILIMQGHGIDYNIISGAP